MLQTAISKPFLIALIYCLWIPTLRSQNPPAESQTVQSPVAGTQPPPSFEVATIKPTRPDNHKPIGLYTYPGGRLFAGQSTLKMLIEFAFNVKDFQIIGGPDWTNEEMYEVTAIPPDASTSRQMKPPFINSPPSDEQREMLKSLLVERFGLHFHEAPKEGPVYFLVRNNKPVKMQDAKSKGSVPVLVIGGRGSGGMVGKSIEMSFMCLRLSDYLNRPVIDKTGLKGSYDFEPDAPSQDSHEASEGDFLIGIFDSVAQLGLNLKPGRAAVRTIFIDRVTKPTDN